MTPETLHPFVLRCSRQLPRGTYALDVSLWGLAHAMETLLDVQQGGWDWISLTPAPEQGTMRAKITGKQVLAVGAMGPRRRRRSKRGA